MVDMSSCIILYYINYTMLQFVKRTTRIPKSKSTEIQKPLSSATCFTRDLHLFTRTPSAKPFYPKLLQPCGVFFKFHQEALNPLLVLQKSPALKP